MHIPSMNLVKNLEMLLEFNMPPCCTFMLYTLCKEHVTCNVVFIIVGLLQCIVNLIQK
jgi:hypothetical protein